MIQGFRILTVRRTHTKVIEMQESVLLLGEDDLL